MEMSLREWQIADKGIKFILLNWVIDNLYYFFLNTFQKMKQSWRNTFPYVPIVIVIEFGPYLRDIQGERYFSSSWNKSKLVGCRICNRRYVFVPTKVMLSSHFYKRMSFMFLLSVHNIDFHPMNYFCNLCTYLQQTAPSSWDTFMTLTPHGRQIDFSPQF